MNEELLKRRDGKISFSPRGRAIADRRTSTKKGRINKVLGKGGPFTPEFKKTVLDDHEQILERAYLVDELEGAKKVLNALATAPDDPNSVGLLYRLHASPADREEPCVLCPIWRHEYSIHRTAAAVFRYVFREVRFELYQLTIIFDYAENLHQLEQKFDQAHKTLKEFVAIANRKRFGIMMVGALEPNLRSRHEFDTMRDMKKMESQLNWQVGDSGGWVLSGHFFVRAPSKDDIEDILNKMLPSSGWTRVLFQSITKKNNLMEHLMSILNYSAKYPSELFDPPTRGVEKKKVDQWINSMESAFFGPSFDADKAVGENFGLMAAIRQWALFMDRVGPDKIYYSVESVHAQKWYSQTEVQYLRESGLDMYSDGRHRVEIHRDTGPFSRHVTQPNLKGNLRFLRSRPLQEDREWMRLTDIGEANSSLRAVSFDRWMLKPK